ncbi:MAG TPA: endonuclease/exonuclease/phosphatase family protein [Gemmatimonadaceae bacterium]|nr:endonuclease/exonuclease/phosphatase family protein [Gemmatimonadaceae bacterium]
MHRRLLLLGMAMLFAGCTMSEPTSTVLPPDAALSSGASLPPAGARGFTAMTRNLFLGGDVFAVAVPGPDPLPLRVTQFWQAVQASRFPERAGAIAREIAATSPHLVGLQEVPLYRIDPLGDGIIGGTNPATLVALDFLSALLDSLDALGLQYDAVSVQQGTDIEVPMIVSLAPLQFMDLRYTDRSVILSRRDVPTGDPRGGVYDHRLTIPVEGVMVSVLRAWTSVVATVGGNSYRFVNTHLETQGAPPIQVGQAGELLGLVAAEPLPVVMVGDFNSAADRSQTASYGMIVDQGGFVDAWSEANGDDPGYTSTLPLFGEADLKERIDIIFLRQGFGDAKSAGIVGGVHAVITGAEESDRTVSGLWPSDHAGVVATFRLPPASGRK